MQQLIERNIERHREADGHLGGKPKAVCFVVGDQGLHDADLCGEFDLSESALPADASDSWPMDCLPQLRGGRLSLETRGMTTPV